MACATDDHGSDNPDKDDEKQCQSGAQYTQRIAIVRHSLVTVHLDVDPRVALTKAKDSNDSTLVEYVQA